VVGAGHPPLLISRKSGAVELIASAVPPLGLIELPHFVETIVELGRDDAFVLYTDGLFGGAEGKRRLTPKMLAKTVDHDAPTAEALLTCMLNQVAPSDGKTRLPDDMAVVVVRRTA